MDLPSFEMEESIQSSRDFNRKNYKSLAANSKEPDQTASMCKASRDKGNNDFQVQH
jgi:hypothetical protein